MMLGHLAVIRQLVFVSLLRKFIGQLYFDPPYLEATILQSPHYLGQCQLNLISGFRLANFQQHGNLVLLLLELDKNFAKFRRIQVNSKICICLAQRAFDGYGYLLADTSGDIAKWHIVGGPCCLTESR